MKSKQVIKLKALVVISAVLLFGAGCAVSDSVKNNAVVPAANGNAARPPARAPISDNVLANLGYPFDESLVGKKEITLENGEAELKNFDSPDAIGNGFVNLYDIAARGDIDGDGAEDAVVVLLVNTGGTGTWPVAFAVMNHGGKPFPVRLDTFEDRAEIKSLAVRGDTVDFSMLVHGDGDPMCCPTVYVDRLYQYRTGDRFEEIELPADHNREASVDLKQFLPLTTKTIHSDLEGAPPDETDVYRAGVLIFEVKPQYPNYDSEAGKNLTWTVELQPISNNDFHASLKTATFVGIHSPSDQLRVDLLEEGNTDPGEVWFKIGDKWFIYDLAKKSFKENID